MLYNKKIIATIEARMTSTRLPQKVMLDLAGKPVLYRIVERLKRSKYLDDIVIVTSTDISDDVIVDFCKVNNISCFRGSLDDVMLRVLDGAKAYNADIIVEITGDCPVISYEHVDLLIEKYFEKNVDYAANIIERTYPRGFDTQVFSVETLQKASDLTDDMAYREHVSLYIYRHPEIFSLYNYSAKENEPFMYHPEFEITLDTKEDYTLISKLYDDLYKEGEYFTARDVVEYLINNPFAVDIIKNVKRKTHI